MWMEVHISSVKAKSNAGNVWVKRPKQKKNQQEILKL